MRTLSSCGLVSLVMLILAAPLGLQARDALADDVQSGELVATPLEAFAANPSTVIVWASPIGRLEARVPARLSRQWPSQIDGR
jgi:hypothetical protein